MLQETKLKPKEKISCVDTNEFQVYYLNRQNSCGGGVALGVSNDFESTLIREGNDDCEAISVKVFLKEIGLRVVAAYGPQENALKDKKESFWEFLEEEVNHSEFEEEGLIIQMDGNLHAGPDIIKNDPNKQNKNGQLFSEFLNRNPQLFVVNSLDICDGLITRKRELENKTEEAVLDFFIMNEQMRQFLMKMKVDEEKEFGLLNLAQIKKNGRIIETDHNGLIIDMDVNLERRKPERRELFNLRNKAGQEAFYQETETNEELLKCFENNLPLDVQSAKWKKAFENVLHKCFKKIRIVKKKDKTNADKILLERVKLKKEIKSCDVDAKMKEKIEERIKQIEETIGEEVTVENHKVIVDTLKQLGDGYNLNGSGRRNLWSLLKKKFPKSSQAVPVAKKDSQGNLVTNHMQLKRLYLKTYTDRMRNRPMKEDLEDLKNIKEDLFKLRLKLARRKKSKPWTLEDLELVLKSLKNDKARDPNGWANELFKDGVAGRNLKLSLLRFFNRMRAKNEIPDFIRLADVSTIYKGKGPKSELVNDRGIFIVTILRSILMRLIYLDYYTKLDDSMSDSQVGARKGKNVRNHLWIVNGIISDILSSKTKKPIDIQIFDYKQCFDSLWLQECMNDLYSAGLDDEKFALLYNINAKVNIAVKTPVGMTERQIIENVVTQGDVFGPMFCSKQVDTFGQECMERGKYTYTYRGEVEIPPLSMVDDLLCISECGIKTSMAHAYLTFKTDSKKLQFGSQKCKKLHVGKTCENFKCQTLEVDNWKEAYIRNEETGIGEIEDVCEGKVVMEEKTEEKYLGDVISTDGRNIKNVKARIEKGKGIVSRILTVLDGIPFGRFYFEIAAILRDSLLVSSMLFNTEAWYNVSKAELDLLETVDVQFMRSVLQAPKSTPKEILFLEMGCIPFRDLIRKRRILFLHYILHESEDSMMNRFLVSQMKTMKAKDWITQVLKDLKYLKLNLEIQEIKEMKKSKLKKLLDKAVEEKAFEELQQKKGKHTKVMNLSYSKLKMQKYLKANNSNNTVEEAQVIFKLRSRMTDVKANFKNKYEEFECDICKDEEETQKHILECEDILKNTTRIKKETEYEELFKDNVKNQTEIAKMFIENMKVKKKLMEKT